MKSICKLAAVAAAVVALAPDAAAAGRRSRAVVRAESSVVVRSAGGCAGGVCEVSAFSAITVTSPGDGADALAEVNALRAARGLPPYLPDPALTAGAKAAAAARAARGLFGHTANDFAFLPPNATAAAAGCAAYPDAYGWMSCAVYDRYTYAGAAWVRGADGRRFMHLFVR